MKSRSSNRRDFFRQQMHGRNISDSLLELVKPGSEWERTQSAIEDILRWAGDGGQMLDIGNVPYSSKADTAGKRANE